MKINLRWQKNYRFESAQVTFTRDFALKNVDFHVSKFNRSTWVLNSKMDFYFEFDSKFTSKFNFYGYRANQYTTALPSQTVNNVCEYLKNMTWIYPYMKSYTNMPEQGPDMCPIKTGNYWLHDYAFNSTGLPDLGIGHDKVKIGVKMFYEKELELEFALYLEIN